MRVVFSITTSFVLVTLYASIDLGRAPVNDDYGISLMLSGLYAENGPCLFINALLSQIVLVLNAAFPELNWFFVLERVSVFCSLSLLSFGLLSYVKRLFAFLTLCFVYLGLLIPSITLSNFTFVGAVAVMAGLVMAFGPLMDSSIAKKRKREYLFSVIAGGLFVAVGFMWRREVALLALPSIFILVFYSIARCFWRPDWKKLVRAAMGKAAISIATIFLVCGCVFVYDEAVWSREEYAEWKDYNSARAALSDYPLPPFEEISERLAEIGVSENDYWMMGHWATADSEVFTTEKLAAVAELVPRENVVQSIASGFFPCFRQLQHSGSFRAALICALICVIVGSRKERVVVILICVMSYFISAYFVGQGRFLDRVRDPIWLYSLISMVLLFARASPDVSDRSTSLVGRTLLFVYRGANLNAVGLFVWCVVFCWAIFSVLPSPWSNASLRIAQGMSSYEPQNELVSYMLEEQDKIFVFDPASGNGVSEAYEYYFFPDQTLFSRYYSTGGWGTGSPMIRSSSERTGIPNIIKDLATNKNALFVSANNSYADKLLLHLREHYSSETKMEVVESIG